MKIRCELCPPNAPKFDKITEGHLKYRHGITTTRYRELFPDAFLVSEEYSSNMGKSQTLRFETPIELASRLAREKAAKDIETEKGVNYLNTLLGPEGLKEFQEQRNLREENKIGYQTEKERANTQI